MDDRVFYTIKIDCEPLAAKSPACGGPESWEVSERTIKRLAHICRERELVEGCEFHLTPEAAKAHPDLFRALRDEGFGVGIQPNVPVFRYPTYDKDLGCYSPDEQREALRLAFADWQEAVGGTPCAFTSCCNSMSDDTLPILDEMGVRQVCVSGPGRYLPDRPDKSWAGVFPYPHHASAKSKLICGSLDVYAFPATVEVVRQNEPNWPKDLRPERPVSEETHASYRQVIRDNLWRMQAMNVPVRYIRHSGHNTGRVNFENFEFVIDAIREISGELGLRVVPAHLEDIHREADALGAY